MFYLVGAGGGGRSYSSTSSTPGAGGSAVLINMFGRNMPSSVSIVIGSGGAGGNTSVNGGDGGDSTITFGSTVLTAVGGFGGRASSDSRQAGVIRLVQPGDPNQFDVDPVSAEGGALRFYIPNANFNSVYGGSTGGHYYSGVLYAPGVSTYGGTGGLGSSSGTASAGAVPGGGGGGGYGGSSSGTTSGAGGNGNCRIYY